MKAKLHPVNRINSRYLSENYQICQYHEWADLWILSLKIAAELFHRKYLAVSTFILFPQFRNTVSVCKHREREGAVWDSQLQTTLFCFQKTLGQYCVLI